VRGGEYKTAAREEKSIMVCKGPCIIWGYGRRLQIWGAMSNFEGKGVGIRKKPAMVGKFEKLVPELINRRKSGALGSWKGKIRPSIREIGQESGHFADSIPEIWTMGLSPK